MANKRTIQIAYSWGMKRNPNLYKAELLTRACTPERAILAAHRRVVMNEFTRASVFNPLDRLIATVKRNGMTVTTEVYL